MSAAAVAAIVVTAVLVAALAFYLIWILLILRDLTDTLSKVLFGVRAIAHRVQPVGEVVDRINTDLDAVGDALEQLGVELGTSGERASRAS